MMVRFTMIYVTKYKSLDMSKSKQEKGEKRFYDNWKFSRKEFAGDNRSLHNLFVRLYPFDEILYRTHDICAAYVPSAFSDGRLT